MVEDWGNVREDIVNFVLLQGRYTFNRRCFSHNKAHVVMLMDQKIIQRQSGAKILSCLRKQNSKNIDPNAEDIHMAIEEAYWKNWIRGRWKRISPRAVMTK